MELKHEAAERPDDVFRIREVERGGLPFLWYRDDADEAHVYSLSDDAERIVLGRDSSCDLILAWDDRVSRSHAELVRVGGDWAIQDDGLSSNGTFVNGERTSGRRRLADRDVIRIGRTALLFRRPDPAKEGVKTVVPPQSYPLAPLTDIQRKVLAALCRPCALAGGYASPTTNEDIAGELHLSIDAVKAHLRTLFGKFAVGDLAQNQKRMRLVQLALEAGVVDDLLRG